MEGTVVVIVLICGLLTFLYYNSKKKNTNVTTQNQIQSENNSKIELDNDKIQIKIELEKMRSKHLNNLINYYVTLFSQTELNNQTDRDRIAETYPKTLSRESFKFTYLYKAYDANLVNECIMELLDKSENLEIDNSIAEPFLKFEIFTKKEAELKARNIFDDFSRNKMS